MRKKLILIACLAVAACLLASGVALAKRKVIYMLTPSIEEALGMGIKELRARSVSSIVRGVEKGKVEIFLYSDNERIETLKKPSCGEAIGDKKRRGRFMLVSVKGGLVTSKVVLGDDHFFVEGLFTRRINDGIRTLPGINDNTFAIYQHLGCTIKSLEFFRVEDDATIKRVPFKDKDGLEFSKIFTGFKGDVGRRGEEHVFCSPYVAVKHTMCLSYDFTGHEFMQASSWMDSIKKRTDTKDPAPAYSVNGEAKHTLFKYLMALSKADYKRAAFYYGGSYRKLRRMNPSLNSLGYKPQGYEFLKRYCTANRGRCYIPTSIKDSVFARGVKGMDPKLLEALGKIDKSDGTMKFTVEFVSPSYKKLRIEGRKGFDFRVMKTSKGPKVLDLPPRRKKF